MSPDLNIRRTISGPKFPGAERRILQEQRGVIAVRTLAFNDFCGCDELDNSASSLTLGSVRKAGTQVLQHDE
jgi:hypothetical protein